MQGTIPDMPPPLSIERKTNNFDFLRFIGTTTVCFAHSFNLSGNGARMPFITIRNYSMHPGILAVMVFFIISGYLIAKSAHDSSSVLHYLWKRFLRAQPLLVVYCVAAVVILGFFSTLSYSAYIMHPFTWSYFRNIMPVFGAQFDLPGVFMNNPSEHSANGALWSLVLEERLYVWAILLFLLFKKNKGKWFVMITLALALIIFLLQHITHLNFRIHESTPYYGFLFMVGSALYIFRFKSTLLTLLIVFIAWYLGVLLFNNFAEYITLALFPVIIIAFALIKTPVSGFAKYGDFSYGLYLFSVPVQQILLSQNSGNINPWLFFLISFSISLLLAVLSWHTIEKKFLRMRNRIR